MPDYAIRGDLVTEDRVLSDAYLIVQGDRIAEISADAPAGLEVIDHSGCAVLPGGVDAHVHSHSSLVDPEGWTRITQCAAAGGVTTIIDMPYDAPEPTITPERVRAKIKALEADGIVDVALYGTVQKHGGAAQVASLLEAGVCAFKLSTYETDPARFPRISDLEITRIFAALEAHPLGSRTPVAFHAENMELVDALVAEMRSSGESDGILHARSRPELSEVTDVVKLLELARGRDVRLHIVHLTVPRMFDVLREARVQGVNVTAETCIHYLTLDETELTRQRGFAKCNPPLRSKETQAGLWDKLLESEIDFVTTDHAPWAPHLKTQPNIFDNKSGLPGLETLLPLLYSAGVADRGLSLEHFAHLIATNPARWANLYPQKGALRVGADADIAVIDPRLETTLRGADSHSVAAHSVYEGWTLRARIVRTISRGETVFADGRVTGQAGRARFVRPSL
jgi:allantoinase